MHSNQTKVFDAFQGATIMIPVSVLILTLNEEVDLPGCLDSLAWSDDIHVLDSYSTDGTVTIARDANVHLHQRTFDGYASQRNFGLHEIEYRYPWLLIVDADERIPKPLAYEIEQTLESSPPSVAAYRIRRRDFLDGRWLKHVQASPWFIRLVRPGLARYEREVNEILRPGGPVKQLHEPFDHYPFSKGLAHWIDKHNQYSSMEAVQVLQSNAQSVSLVRTLLERDFNKRRALQKALFYKLPLRPQLRFFVLYFIKLGFLDGSSGLTYARLQSTYEHFIVLKTRELNAKVASRTSTSPEC